MAQLKAAGLSAKPAACVFLSTAYGAADTLGITLTPEEAGKVYKYAKEHGAIGVDDKGNPSTYYVDSYPGIIAAVAAVKNVDRNNLLIPKTQTKCSSNDKEIVTKEILGALQSGGTAQVRYSGHSMRVDGSFVENGNIILSIKDTLSPNTKTYVDTDLPPKSVPLI